MAKLNIQKFTVLEKGETSPYFYFFIDQTTIILKESSNAPILQASCQSLSVLFFVFLFIKFGSLVTEKVSVDTLIFEKIADLYRRVCHCQNPIYVIIEL